MKKTSRLNVRNMTQAAILIALIVVMTVLNIGNIPVGPIVATIYQVPVIIGAIMMGPMMGAFLGGLWGLLCFLLAVTGNTTDVVALATVQQSVWLYFVIAFVPRLLTGLFSGLIFKGLDKLVFKKRYEFSLVITGAVGSLCNTVLYLGSLFIFIRSLLANLYDIELGAVGAMVMGVATTNGLVEAGVSAILTLLICKVLFVVMRKRRAR